MNPQKLLDKAKIGLMMQGSVFLSTITFSLQHVFVDSDSRIATAATDGKTVWYNKDYFTSLSPEQRVGLVAHESWHLALSHMIRRGNRDPELYNIAGDHVINLMLLADGFQLPAGGCWNNKYKNMSTEQVYNDLKKDEEKHKQKVGNTSSDIIYTEPDKAQEENATTKLEEHIASVIVRAMTQEKLSNTSVGNVPGEVGIQLDKILNPKLPWETLLQQFLLEKVKDDYSWSKPNKRYLPDFYMPSVHSESLANLTIAIDTSGSMSNKDLQSILSEITYIRESLKPQKLVIIDCDYQIHNIFHVTDDINLQDLKFEGGGGSRCHPVFEYCDKHIPTALIYFTDLQLPMYTESVEYPVMWIVYANLNPKVQVGEIIQFD